MNKKYNLTFWQWLNVPLLWMMWTAAATDERKSWHEVLKGMEKHECRFTKLKIHWHKGSPVKLYQCEHEGCNLCDVERQTI